MSAKVQKPGNGRTAGVGNTPSAVEYGILVAGLAVVIIALVFMFGPRVKRMLGAGGPPAPPTEAGR